MAGDAFFAVSLADSLFFAVSADAARPSILLYLLLTLAPFAIVGPFVGSLIDRFPGKQRALIAGTNLGRAVAMVLVGWQRTSLLFFPLAFTVLVFGKAASVTKSALVPGLVRDHSRLVAENARLTRMVAVTSVSAGGLAAGALMVANAKVVLFAGAIIHLLAIPLAWRIPSVPVGSSQATSDNVKSRGGPLTIAAERDERRQRGNRVCCVSAGVRTQGHGPAGMVLRAGDCCWRGRWLPRHLRGHRRSPMAPRRGSHRHVSRSRERRRLAHRHQLPTCERRRRHVHGRLGGEHRSKSLRQSDATFGAGRRAGSSLRKFETRFQIAWVFGAVLPVLLQPSTAVGLQLLGIALGVALLAYLGGGHAARASIIGSHQR